MTNTGNELTSELKQAEEDIDNYYKSNPLVKLPFATAAWSFLAFVEDYMLIKSMQIDGIQNLYVLGSDFLVELEYSISWLYGACQPDGQISFNFDDDYYKASMELFELGKKYESFVFAYTCAHHGWIGLNVEEFSIQPTGNFFKDFKYEAYNILIDASLYGEALSAINFNNFPKDAIEHSLKVQDDRFRYKLNPRMVSDTIAFLKPLFDEIFSLPNEWKFSRYSLGDFRQVFEAICAIAHIHWTARKIAVTRGCESIGYLDSIYLPTCDELRRRVVRYSGVSNAKVENILDDLTYGNNSISHSELAMRPLIKLNSEYYAIVPHVWICSSAERNFAALLNRLKSEKKIYLKLAASEKETLMRQRITINLSDKGFRFEAGSVANQPDIDLAIIDDSEKTCLLLELKWFIAPTVARERIEKSEEIEKGISQVIKLQQTFANNQRQLLDKLRIDSSYRLEGVVVSQNWIGYANVQSPKVPVIRTDHLIAKLKAAESLQSTIEWLKDRKYLPKEGEHFKIVDGNPLTIGNWSLITLEAELLVRDTFFPL